MTRGQQKSGRLGSSRTPFGILADLVTAETLGQRDTPAARLDAVLWAEWEASTAGRRLIGWTPGLREWVRTHPAGDQLPIAGLAEAERTDLEVVNDDRGGQTVAFITGELWADLCRRGLALAVKWVFRDRGDEAGLAWLSDQADRLIQQPRDRRGGDTPDPD
jgi:hypothetical protein